MPNFSEKEWKKIVKGFFEKYQGLKEWHNALVKSVYKNKGIIKNPSGRILSFNKYKNKRTGVFEYSRTQIVNYPVQSGSADLVYLAMAVINRRKNKYGFKSPFILQVHDSLAFDCIESERNSLAELCIDTFRSLPKLAKNYWGWDIPVNMDGDAEYSEVSYGDLDKLILEEVA